MRTKGTWEQLETRRRVAMRLLESGQSTSEVAEAVGASERSVYRWRRAKTERGDEALAGRKPPGPQPQLDQRQREELARIIDRGARAQGFSSDLWTCARVAKVVRRKFGVEYHPSHAWRILRDLGFTPQKPERRARERDERAAHWWREHEWPRVKKGSRAKS